MSVTLSLWSTKNGEIQRFLSRYYQKDYTGEVLSQRWIEDFNNPLESVDMISALMDNIEFYDMSMYIHMDNGFLHKITKDNYDDVIKGLFDIYYVSI